MQKSKDSTSDKSSSLKLSVFDIEVLPNVFIISIGTVGGSIDTFEISTRVNQISDLKDYFLKGDRIFVGYNCIYYDTPVMNFLLMNYDRLIRYDALGITKELKEVSDKLINNVVGDKSLTRYKYAKSYNQIDLMTLLASQALRVGLKSLQVTMCYPNVEEMTVDWDSDFDMDKIQSLIYYCDNDILSTSALLKLLKEDLVLRQFIQKEFHIECLSKDGVGVGVDIFTKYICEDLGLSDPKDLMNYRVNPSTIYLSDIIVDAISFKTKPLQDTLKWFKSLVLDGTGRLPNGKNPETKVRIGNLVHSCGVGGLHSENQPKVYPKRNDVIYRDKDVVSYYPSLSIEWGFGPSGFKTPFINVLKFLKSERVIAKRAGDKSKDSTYKLALNSILGNLRNEYSPYYAPEANLGISINGQLMLLMLIETCELNGIECFMSNTNSPLVL